MYEFRERFAVVQAVSTNHNKLFRLEERNYITTALFVNWYKGQFTLPKFLNLRPVDATVDVNHKDIFKWD